MFLLMPLILRRQWTCKIPFKAIKYYMFWLLMGISYRDVFQIMQHVLLLSKLWHFWVISPNAQPFQFYIAITESMLPIRLPVWCNKLKITDNEKIKGAGKYFWSQKCYVIETFIFLTSIDGICYHFNSYSIMQRLHIHKFDSGFKFHTLKLTVDLSIFCVSQHDLCGLVTLQLWPLAFAWKS